MSRRINKEALDLIKRWEGLKLEAYQDTGGVWTIGYGHTLTAKPGMRILESTAEELLRRDLRDAERAVERMVKVDLTDGQFGALVSFVFNVGAEAFRTSTLLKRLNSGDYDAVPGQLMRWVKDNGRTLPGLVNRRAAEVGLWSRGAHVTGAAVPVATPAEPVSATAAGGIAGTAATVAGAVGPALASLAGLPWQVGVALALAGAVAAVAWIWRRERAA